MFEKIFSFPAVLRRHREGPLASERLEYLKYLNDRGLTLGSTVTSVSLPSRYTFPFVLRTKTRIVEDSVSRSSRASIQYDI